MQDPDSDFAPPFPLPGGGRAPTAPGAAGRRLHGRQIAAPWRRPLWQSVVVIGALHGLIALASILISRQSSGVAGLWCANASSTWILLGRPRRDWPALLASVALAGLCVNLAVGNSPGVCAGFTLADLLEIIVGAGLLSRLGRLDVALIRPEAMLRVLLLGAVAPAVVGASVGGELLAAIRGARIGPISIAWFDASTVGAVAVLPLGLLLLTRGQTAAFAVWRDARMVAVLAVTIALAAWVPARAVTPYIYTLGLLGLATLGRVPAVAWGILLTAVALLVPIISPLTRHPASGAGEPSLMLIALAFTLVLPLILAVTLERIQHEVELAAEREQTARLLYRKTPVMMHTVDSQRRLVEVSDAWLDRLGYQREEVLGRPAGEFLTPASREVAERELMPRLYVEGMLRDAEFQMVSRTGEVVDLRASVIWERDPAGTPIRAMAVLKDITQEKRLAAELLREQERTAVTLHSIAEGVVTTDELGHIRYLNPVAEALLGWGMAEAVGRRFGDVVHLLDQGSGAALLDPVERCLRDGQSAGLPVSAVIRDRQGREYAVEDSLAPIRGKQGELLGTVMVFQDVTEERDRSRKMAHLAHHDALTDLPNRALFHDRVQQVCQFARRDGGHFAVMFMDLDHFKNVNDSLGHAVGDELLKTVARRLTGTLRASDTVSRLGGDEFVILVTNIDAAPVAGEVARKILSDVAQPCVLEGTEIRVSVSLGIAMYPEDGEDPDTLMKHADAAMYRSKREGRNRFDFFLRDVDEPATARLQLEADLRHGIAAGEFQIYFQPIVNAQSRVPIAVEALARWVRGARGVEPPSSFIAVAEENGLIVPLGESILRQACQQLAAWAGSALAHVRVSVNVSRVQLADAGFVATVAGILRATGALGHLLEIEITESTLMKNPDRAHAVLNELKALGVRVAIDDFGTGYSSLSSLQSFPVDTVKIDRSFVADLETNPSGREVVNAILAMARSLRLEVVAEGVERDSQARILTGMKCPTLQGFLFSEPVTPESMSAWLTRRGQAPDIESPVQSSLFF